MPKKKKALTEPKVSIQITLPYTPEASKNRKFKWRSGKHLSEGYSKFVSDVCLLTQNETRLKNVVWQNSGAKVNVDFTLYRLAKHSRTDAHNFLEAVCDGVKAGIGIDDCYFTTKTDWEVVETEPHFLIRVSQ